MPACWIGSIRFNRKRNNVKETASDRSTVTGVETLLHIIICWRLLKKWRARHFLSQEPM